MSTLTADPSHRGPAATSVSKQKFRHAKATPRRTTVALTPEAAEIVAQFQGATGLSLSETISELIERSQQRPSGVKYIDGLPTADIPMDGEWITTADVLRAQAELG
jgi:hypothetical protein